MLDLVAGLVLLVAGPVLVVWWLPFVVHEWGHWAGAKLAGANVDYLPLGPWMLPRTFDTPRRLRLRIRRFPCDAAVPVAGRARSQLFFATAGGPALSIALGVGLLALGFLGDLGRSAYLAPLVLIVVGLFMAMHGAMILLPWRPYGVPSDGRRLWSLLVQSRSGRRWMAMKEQFAQTDAGVRPRDWPAAQMNQLVIQSDGTIDDINAALHLYWHLLDSRRLTEARACLEQARAAASQHYMAQLNGQIVLLELAYMEAQIGPDPAIAVQNLMRSAFLAKATLQRVLAAIALSYANLDGALTAASAAANELPDLRPGFRAMERDLIAELVGEAERRRDGLPAPAHSIPSDHNGVDVSRYAVPDVPLREPPPPQGLRSSRALVGFVGVAMVCLGVYGTTTAFAPAIAPLLTFVPGVLIAFAVLRVRRSRGRQRIDRARVAFAALAVIFFASPLLAGDLLRPSRSGYIWIVGQTRPCTNFGTGHDQASLTAYLFVIAFGMVGLLMGTRAAKEQAVPKMGVALGVGLIVLWLAAIASDHAHFAAVIGCPQ